MVSIYGATSVFPIAMAQSRAGTFQQSQMLFVSTVANVRLLFLLRRLTFATLTRVFLIRFDS
jgi:hypothetical protein